MKTPDDFAREFKLHNCIGNPRFAAQVRAIQEDALKSKPVNPPKQYVKS